MAIQRSSPAVVNLGTALNSLASSATVGAQSGVVTSSTTANVTDITANIDIALPSIATPTGSTKVDVYCWGTNDDAGYPGGSVTNEVITGSPGALTISSIATNAIRWIGCVTVTLTSTVQTVRMDASVVASLGYVPRRWGLVFINNTGAALGASGHAAEYVETYYN